MRREKYEGTIWDWQKTEYIHRYWKIHSQSTWKWYEHQPNTVTENNNVIIFWDIAIEKKANKPEMDIKGRNEK